MPWYKRLLEISQGQLWRLFTPMFIHFGIIHIWIRGKFDPFSGLYLHQQTVIMMIFWFFLCLSGVIGNVANTAHGVGLVIGIVWGFVSARLAKRKYIR